jgi:hypothetical protein
MNPKEKNRIELLSKDHMSFRLKTIKNSCAHIALGFSVSIFLWSCNKEEAPDCLQTAGKYETELRTLTAFDQIELRDYIQIELYDSTETFIEVTGPRNLLTDVKTEVTNGLLKIENKNTCNFVRSYKNKITVRIYAPSFPDIQNYGTGDIKSINTLTSSYFKIENRKAGGVISLTLNVDSAALYTHTGVCDIKCNGTSTKTMLFNQGLGIIDARNLISTDSFVNNSSINNVYVNSNGYLFAFIQFSGNVYYTGTPNFIDTQIEGTGLVIKTPE